MDLETGSSCVSLQPAGLLRLPFTGGDLFLHPSPASIPQGCCSLTPGLAFPRNVLISFSGPDLRVFNPLGHELDEAPALKTLAKTERALWKRHTEAACAVLGKNI